MKRIALIVGLLLCMKVYADAPLSQGRAESAVYDAELTSVQLVNEDASTGCYTFTTHKVKHKADDPDVRVQATACGTNAKVEVTQIVLAN